MLIQEETKLDPNDKSHMESTMDYNKKNTNEFYSVKNCVFYANYVCEINLYYMHWFEYYYVLYLLYICHLFMFLCANDECTCLQYCSDMLL